jgi:hypothetical protein
MLKRAYAPTLRSPYASFGSVHETFNSMRLNNINVFSDCFYAQANDLLDCLRGQGRLARAQMLLTLPSRLRPNDVWIEQLPVPQHLQGTALSKPSFPLDDRFVFLFGRATIAYIRSLSGPLGPSPFLVVIMNARLAPHYAAFTCSASQHAKTFVIETAAAAS